ncbi:DUF461 domain-containing protein [Streptomyces sp. JJ38]|uniref:DUF461 domain-containing protein n=1 Tax=Streptomyces sp. JJ38 TaxID=2738128 RepID=UPI001C581D24|nr:DUF461 domain-containing protein [Streptomyces sp. JJ38]
MSSSRSSLRRGAVAAAVLALSSLSLAGCGAGFEAGTSQVRPDTPSEQVGDIALQNVLVITSEDGEGPAGVTATIFNNGDKAETLRGITFAAPGGDGSFELSPAEGDDLTVPAGGRLVLGGEGHASAVVEGEAAQEIHDGEAQQLTFELSSTGDIDIKALVFPSDQDHYAPWGPSPAPGAEQAPAGEEAEGAEETPGGETPDDSAGEPAEGESAEAGTQDEAESPADEGTESIEGSEGSEGVESAH